MPPGVARNRFPISLFATPQPLHQELFYTVLRAGHLIAGPEHHIQRDHFPGHEMILCLRGNGWVRIAGRTHPVNPGQFVWINCHRPHEHGAVPENPWEVYWIRAEGPKLTRLGEVLDVAKAPVFSEFDTATAAGLFEELFRHVAVESPEAPALIHAAVARLVALMYCARQQQQPASEPAIPPALSKAVAHMKQAYFERLRVADLARLSGMSVSHFNRVFRRALDTSPIDWLRNERIRQAQRRLVETTDSIQSIAEQVGYSDRFFFSKDFKRQTGMTPRQFREGEAQRSE